MDSLQIKTGLVRIEILDDAGESRGIFKFNPEDVQAAQRFFNTQEEFIEKHAEFDKRAKEAQTVESELELLNEIVDYIEQLIDECFGEGTSELLFGDNKTLSMFDDFFEGITPYYKKASEARKAKYRKPVKNKKSGK